MSSGESQNINVCVRIRPPNSREEALGGRDTPWVFTDKSIAQVAANGSIAAGANFAFDHVFGPNDCTDDLYEAVAAPG